MSLRTRLALLVGGTVLLASVIGGVGIAVSSRGVGVDRVDTVLRADAARVDLQAGVEARLRPLFELRRATCEDTTAEGDGQTDAVGGNRPVRPGLARANRLLLEFASTLQLIRPNGEVLAACLGLPVDGVDLDIATSGSGETVRTVTVDGERFRVLTVGAGDVGALQFARSLELTDDTMRALLVRTVLFGALGAVLAGLIGWAVARRATRPIERLSDAADRVARTRDLGERIDVEGNDEIATLARSFNTMLGSLDTMREQQHRLVQDASHELRTPLTSIRTNIELLRRRDDVPATMRSEMLADISTELDELTALTAELVDSATEVRSDPARSTSFDLARVVSECVDTAARRHGRTIDLDIERSPTADGSSGTAMQGDPGLVARAVTNLLNNAAKFADATTGPIEVTVRGRSVRVRDHGPGIDEADLPHIFDRFYRATSARSAPGSGLGLSIVKQIVEIHGGSLSASNHPAGGLDIGFSLGDATARIS